MVNPVDTNRQWLPDGTSIPLKVKDGEVITPPSMNDMPMSAGSCGAYDEVIEEKRVCKDVPERLRGYYQLQGRYTFWNSRAGKSASVTGYSTVTKRKCRGEELENLRWQAIDNARGRLCALPDFPCEWWGECALIPDFLCEWVVVEIEHEVWLKW